MEQNTAIYDMFACMKALRNNVLDCTKLTKWMTYLEVLWV